MASNLGELRVAINLDNTGVGQSLTQMRRDLSVAQQHFRATMAGVDRFNRSLEDLQQEQTSLTNVMRNQVAISQRLESEWQQAIATHGAASDEARRLETQYYRSITAMRRTETQLIQVNQQIENFGNENQQAADEANNLQDQMNAMQAGANHVKSVFLKLAGVIAATFAVDQLKDFGKNMLQVTADSQALESQYVQVMGKMKGKTDAYINEMSKRWNKHPSEIKGALMNYMAILKGKGLSEEEAFITSQKYMQMTVDGNAFANEQMSDSIARTMGIIKGEYDSADTIMINFSQTLLNEKALEVYKKKWDKLTTAQQETLKTQEAIRQQTSAGVVGQGEREADSYNNNLAMIKNTWNDILAIFGSPLLARANETLKTIKENLQGFNAQGMLKDLEQFQRTLQGLFDAVTGGPATTLYALFGFEKGDEILAQVDGIKTSFQELMTTISEIGVGVAESFTGATEGTFNAKEMIIGAIQGILAVIDGLIQGINFIYQLIKPALEAVASLFGTVFADIKKFWDENGGGLQQDFQAFFVWLKEAWTALSIVLLPVIQGLWKIVSSIIRSTVNTILGVIKFFSAMWKGDWEGMKEGLLKIALSILAGLVGIFKGLWTAIKGYFTGMGDNMIAALEKINLGNVGRAIIAGLGKGIDDVMGDIKKKVEGMADKLPTWLKKKLGIHSPSRVMANEVGRHIPTGIAMGIEKSIPSLQRATEKMGLATFPNIDPNIPSSGIAGFSGTQNTTNNTNNFAPNVTVYANDPKAAALEQQRLFRRMAFQGGAR